MSHGEQEKHLTGSGGLVGTGHVLGLEECSQLVSNAAEDSTILMLDESGTIEAYSTSCDHLCRPVAGPLLDKHFRCLYPAEDIEQGRPEQDLQAARERGRIALRGFRVRSDGSCFWAEVVLTALITATGGVRGYVLSTRDVTASCNARQRLDQLEQAQGQLMATLAANDADLRKLATVAQLTDNSVLVTDALGQIEWVNESFTRMTGYSLPEVVGRKPGLLLQGPDTDPATVALMRERLQRGEGFKVEILNYHKHGECWLDIEVQPVHDATGELCHFIALQRNITEQRLAQQRFQATLEHEQHARQEAEATNRLKDDFLATISHELRTPLNGVLGFAKLLRRGRLQPEAAKKAVEVIERNAEAQVRLIEDLLDVSSIVAGIFTLKVRPVEVAKLASMAVDLLQPVAEAKRVQLVYRPDSAVGTVPGDSRRLHQGISNLLTNAIKFTPAGGRIEVSVGRFDGGVEVVVADTGIGIDPEFLPHVFDRFRQADSSSTRNYGGLGLGLSLVRHIVELHGGTISAESAGRGRGAKFTVRLPLQSVRLARADEVQP